MNKIYLVIIFMSGVLLASDVKPINNQIALKECGSCHFAYQPGLLPKRSWKKIFKNLSDHFGTDASLNKNDKQKLLSYFVKNSSDNSNQYLSRVINRYTKPNTTPMRITTGIVFARAHNELRRDIFRRKSIRSSSNCIACHTTASRGLYNEDYVRIPR
ncbi:MAG: cytochrome C [Epsilonproteobacteria bacterium]|nr:cytochrome C [Campylobacterota bacterium]